MHQCRVGRLEGEGGMHLAGDSKSDNSLLEDMGPLHEYRRQWLLSMVVVRSAIQLLKKCVIR